MVQAASIFAGIMYTAPGRARSARRGSAPVRDEAYKLRSKGPDFQGARGLPASEDIERAGMLHGDGRANAATARRPSTSTSATACERPAGERLLAMTSGCKFVSGLTSGQGGAESACRRRRNGLPAARAAQAAGMRALQAAACGPRVPPARSPRALCAWV